MTHAIYCDFHTGQGGCGIVETLFQTKLVCVVGSDDPGSCSARRLQSWNIRLNGLIHQTMYQTPVLAVRMNQTHIVVVRETVIHVYDVGMKLLANIETAPNPRGILALTSNVESKRPILIAYPSRPDRGDVTIYDLHSLVEKRTIPMHKERLKVLQFSPDDTLLATASETGSFIKVVGVDTADNRQWHFRRGFSSASIDCVSFNYDQTQIACSSTNGTVHIFRFPSSGGELAGDGSYADGSPPNSAGGSLGGLLGGSPTAYLSSFLDSGIRSAATIKITPGLHALCGFSRDSSRVFTVTSDGKFSVYQVDFGGRGSKLVQERDLLMDGRKMQVDSDPEADEPNGKADPAGIESDSHDGSQILM
jgi:autophagy-related protein 18